MLVQEDGVTCLLANIVHIYGVTSSNGRALAQQA